MDLIKKLAADERIKEGFWYFRETIQSSIDLAVEIQQIPAPTFDETKRATFIKQKFQKLNLKDVHQDSVGNVLGLMPGDTSGPVLVISAHLDTVFPSDTDLTVVVEDNHDSGQSRVSGPGIADNSLGLAGLLILVEAVQKVGLKFKSDIWIAANVGEEGLGDLRGMRAIVDRFEERASYLIVEGGSYGNIFNQGIGVRRYRIEVNAPGGHSWGDFGEPSAIHILSQLMAQITELQVPSKPKTSFNIGTISGGTSINTIASSATCLLDLRSEDSEQLHLLSRDVEKIIESTVNGSGISARRTEIGNRPTGRLKKTTPIVRWAASALEVVGCDHISLMSGSTDANIPISRGYPSVCIGLAHSGNSHRIDEYFETEELPNGLGQLLLLAAAAAGYKRNKNEL